MTYDQVIRGGTVVDGTRLPRLRSDVGITDGKVAKIGRIGPGEGARELDATGLVVAPGFVDLHTHYDAQITGTPTAPCPAGTASPRSCSATAALASRR